MTIKTHEERFARITAAEQSAADIKWAAYFEAHITEDGDDWCAADTQGSEEVCRCASREAATEEAHRLNAAYLATYVDD